MSGRILLQRELRRMDEENEALRRKIRWQGEQLEQMANELELMRKERREEGEAHREAIEKLRVEREDYRELVTQSISAAKLMEARLREIQLAVSTARDKAEAAKETAAAGAEEMSRRLYGAAEA